MMSVATVLEEAAKLSATVVAALSPAPANGSHIDAPPRLELKGAASNGLSAELTADPLWSEFTPTTAEDELYSAQDTTLQSTPLDSGDSLLSDNVDDLPFVSESNYGSSIQFSFENSSTPNKTWNSHNSPTEVHFASQGFTADSSIIGIASSREGDKSLEGTAADRVNDQILTEGNASPLISSGSMRNWDLATDFGHTMSMPVWKSFGGNRTTCKGGLCLSIGDEAFWSYNFTNDTFGNEQFDPSLIPDEKNWECLLLLLVVFAGVLGNVLVCLAITVEKKLQNVTNYFLMSLAIADLFVSLLVMPCSIVNEFMGKFLSSFALI